MTTKVPPSMVTRNTGDVVQAVTSSSSALATGTTLIPSDNTIPQNTEGDQYLSVTITPTDAASSLEIDVLMYIAHSAAPVTAMQVAVFQDSNANAVAAALNSLPLQNGITPFVVRHVMPAGTTSPTTLKVRAGAGVAGTTTVNGAAGVSYLGGTMQSRITVRELSA